MSPFARRALLGVALAGVAMALLVPRGLGYAGTFLVVDEPLQPARAAVVLGGGEPYRPREAGRLYQQGMATEVWLTRGGPLRPEEEHEHEGQPEGHGTHVENRQTLERHGVPATAIHVLPGETPDTASEIRAIAHRLRAFGGGRVILVTSHFHSRRVRVLWNRIVQQPAAALVRVAPERIDPASWWRRADTVGAVGHEWLGLVSAWVRAQ